ncbi:peptidase inhibitor family I36 protein [Streptomyces sp. BBFR51]|uniref:peptidase inhibitor family I36 protein n=1 Tax=Streptomyces sp. BBFR51 TaxID=3372856 RepID=UPI0037DDD7B0
MKGIQLATFKKQLATVVMGMAAVGATLAGTATEAAAAPAADGGCDAATYEFCLYASPDYKGSSLKVRWGQQDDFDFSQTRQDMWHNVSSVVNNTNYEVAFAKLYGKNYFKVAPFHHLSGLGSADNTSEWVGKYPN